MTKGEAAHLLHDMYQDGKRQGERSIAAELFGIRYATELANFRSQELAEIAALGTGYPNYGNEIGKGRRMARYVQWREQPLR